MGISTFLILWPDSQLAEIYYFNKPTSSTAAQQQNRLLLSRQVPDSDALTMTSLFF